MAIDSSQPHRQSGIETVVSMNQAGRITIPADLCSILDLRDTTVCVTVICDETEVGAVLQVGESGRATIPQRTRRYLGIDGEERDLRLIFDRV